MHYLHMIRTDPSWYLQKLWWAGVLFGLILMVTVALKNRRRNRRKAAEAPVEKVTVKPNPRDRWGTGV